MLRSSFANALYCVVREGSSLDMLHDGPLRGRILAELQTWSKKNIGRYPLRKCDVSVFESHPKWMSDREAGIFSIRIVALDVPGELLNHAVVLDTQRGHVLDPVERFALTNGPVC